MNYKLSIVGIILIMSCFFLPVIFEKYETVDKTGCIVGKDVIAVPINRSAAKIEYVFTMEIFPLPQETVPVDKYDYEKYNLGDSFTFKYCKRVR